MYFCYKNMGTCVNTSNKKSTDKLKRSDARHNDIISKRVCTQFNDNDKENLPSINKNNLLRIIYSRKCEKAPILKLDDNELFMRRRTSLTGID